MSSIGVMQGRLLPPEVGRLQAFPRSWWKEEFPLAASVPVTYIEWIYDVYGADVNPLLTKKINDLKSLMAQTGVAIRSVCADYFIDRPLVQHPDSFSLLPLLLNYCHEVGAQRIVLPFVDNSQIRMQDFGPVVRILNDASMIAELCGVEIHLETSLAPKDFAALLTEVPSPCVKVTYDSGNSASLGYVPAEEFVAIGTRIGSVHVKDRKFGGGSVPLGQGDADFDQVFRGLRQLSYEGDFTLQVARGVPGEEVTWARQNVNFVGQLWHGTGAGVATQS